MQTIKITHRNDKGEALCGAASSSLALSRHDVNCNVCLSKMPQPSKIFAPKRKVKNIKVKKIRHASKVSKLPEEKQKEIVSDFLTLKNNQHKTLAAKHDCTVWQIETVVQNYLNSQR